MAGVSSGAPGGSSFLRTIVVPVAPVVMSKRSIRRLAPSRPTPMPVGEA